MLKYNHRVTEIFAIFSFILLNLLFIQNIFSILFLNFNIIYLVSFLFSILTGYILADFFSGFVHFLGDTFGTENTPLLGESFIKPFREHHVDPKAMTKHDFVETSGNNCIVSLPPMFLVYFYLDISIGYFLFYIYSSFTFLMLFVFITNEIHKYAHLEKVPKWIRFLQLKKIILSPEHHEIHHTAPFDKFYCITSGILNPLLYKIGFFEKIKSLFQKNKQIEEISK